MATETSYRVVFAGRLASGAERATVQAKLARLFNLDPVKAEGLFSGVRVVVKKQGARAECDRIREAFAGAGALAEVELIAAAAGGDAADAPTPAAGAGERPPALVPAPEAPDPQPGAERTATAIPTATAGDDPDQLAHDERMRQRTKRVIYSLAIVAMLVVVTSILGLQITSKRYARILGPTVLASGPGTGVLLVSDGALYRIDATSGEITKRPLADLGLGSSVPDVHFADGSWWVGDSDQGAIFRCTAALESCRRAIGGTGERVALRSFKFAVGPQHVYVTDTARHRLAIYDRDGQLVRHDRGAPVSLCFPNQVTLAGKALLIADTNNHRIARYPLASDGEVETVLAAGRPDGEDPLDRFLERRYREGGRCESLGTTAGTGDAFIDRQLDFDANDFPQPLPGARSGRIWPTAFAQTSDGNWWVLVGSGALDDGDVLILDGEESVRVSLPNGADPFDILVLEDRVLVSDVTNMRVYQVGLAGKSVAMFADETLGDVLAGAAQRKQRYGWLREASRYAIYAGVGLMVVILVVAKRKGVA